MFSLNASSHLLCSGRILNALLFLSAIYVTGSNRVTHGKLFCKEISDVNIWTWVSEAKKEDVILKIGECYTVQN